MIIYNITMKVDPAIAGPWLDWMQTEHIQDIMASGCFVKYHIVRLLDIDESDGPTYAFQFHAPDRASYDRYSAEHAAGLRSKTADRWGAQVVAFRTLMEVVK